MKSIKNTWQREEGGIDFVQLIVGLMIIAIAAVGTFQALIYGYEQLDYEMRYRKAVSVARSYMEYWQGRIHTDINLYDRQVLNGNLGRPEVLLLDERDPTIDYDDVYCQVSYGPIDMVDLPTTGVGTDHFNLRVYVTWWEPEQREDRPPHEILFHASMVPAAL